MHELERGSVGLRRVEQRGGGVRGKKKKKKITQIFMTALGLDAIKRRSDERRPQHSRRHTFPKKITLKSVPQ